MAPGDRSGSGKIYILNADLASVVYMSKHNFAPFKRMSLL